MIYFTRYIHSKLIKIFRVHNDELVGKTEEDEEKNYLMTDICMLVKVLEKIKKVIGFD